MRVLGLILTIWCCVVGLDADETKSSIHNGLLQKFFSLQQPSDLSPEDQLSETSNRLQANFDLWLQSPVEYKHKALSECAIFPEGRIYPFAIPALAYANQALTMPAQRNHSAAQMKKLINVLISIIEEDIHPPEGDLINLTNYQKEATRLATLNLVLACYSMVSDDSQFDNLHTHLSSLLRLELEAQDGKPLASYPEYTWYFDTIMALVSLELHDRAQGVNQTRSLIERHFQWLSANALHPVTSLPIAYKGGLPRGCDLSMQICLLQQIDTNVSQNLYANYVQHHWVDHGVMAGFREWPGFKAGSLLGDIDSGPLILGIGPTATGVGIGATKAIDDRQRHKRLVTQLQYLPPLVKMLESNGQRLFNGQIRVSSDYATGFLYGDAILFYSTTWVQYPMSTEVALEH